MSQIFHPSTNTFSKVSIFGAVFAIVGFIWLLLAVNRSDYVTGVGEAREQPLQFSHERHVAGNGIDCRYCHTTVEDSAFAGIPPTETCMNCHSHILTEADILEPIRASFRTGEPIHWVRVHRLPDFVYFDHSIHVKKGVGCVTCHGRVDRMPLVWKAEPMTMEWCLECHRAPERYLRPREEVFNMEWKPEGSQIALGRRLVAEYDVAVGELTDCYVCHR
jgi:hypothetical protein